MKLFGFSIKNEWSVKILSIYNGHQQYRTRQWRYFSFSPWGGDGSLAERKKRDAGVKQSIVINSRRGARGVIANAKDKVGGQRISTVQAQGWRADKRSLLRRGISWLHHHNSDMTRQDLTAWLHVLCVTVKRSLTFPSSRVCTVADPLREERRRCFGSWKTQRFRAFGKARTDRRRVSKKEKVKGWTKSKAGRLHHLTLLPFLSLFLEAGAAVRSVESYCKAECEGGLSPLPALLHPC